MLMRTLANLFPSLKSAGKIIFHIKSICERRTHTVFFFLIQRTQEEKTPKIFKFHFSFYSPLKLLTAFSQSPSAPLMYHVSCSRMYCRYSPSSVRKTSPPLPLLTTSDIWHLAPRHLKLPEKPLLLSMMDAMCKRKTGVRNNASLCFLFSLQKVENWIHNCCTECSSVGCCYIGARGYLSSGNGHSKTLSNCKVWQLQNTWFDDLKFGQKYLGF